MKRLVHLAPYAVPHSGSFIPFLRGVLLAARDRGWAVQAVLPPAAEGRAWIGELRGAEIPVLFAEGSRRQLARWMRERFGGGEEPTLLHTHFTAYDVAAALAARRVTDLHVYWHIHTVLTTGPRALLANAAKFGLLGRYVDRILVPSAGLAEGVQRRLGDPAKVMIYPSPIDADRFPLLSRGERARYRQELGIPDGSQVLLHFGRDWQIKDGDLFLDALGGLVAQGRPVLGLVNQGGEVAMRAARRRGLQRHVKTVGVLPQPAKLYGAADVMVASSRGEGMPYTMVESLCSGSPVVASDIPGHRYLGNELDACAIVPRDPGQMAAAIGSFLDMAPEERLRLCEGARRSIVERLDVRGAASRLVDAYEQTVRESGSPRVRSSAA